MRVEREKEEVVGKEETNSRGKNNSIQGESERRGPVDLSLFGIFFCSFGGGGIDNFCCGCDRNQRES